MFNGRPGTIYHLSTDKGYEVRDVVRMLCEMMGKDFDSSTISVCERLGQDAAYVIDSSLSRQEFGWSPKVDMEQGLIRVIEWIETNWGQIQKEPLDYQHKA
jgi:dTDP-glucose 4,6-dehydratase